MKDTTITITDHKEHFDMFDVFGYKVRMVGVTFVGVMFIEFPAKHPLALCEEALTRVVERGREIDDVYMSNGGCV